MPRLRTSFFFFFFFCGCVRSPACRKRVFFSLSLGLSSPDVVSGKGRGNEGAGGLLLLLHFAAVAAVWRVVPHLSEITVSLGDDHRERFVGVRSESLGIVTFKVLVVRARCSSFACVLCMVCEGAAYCWNFLVVQPREDRDQRL